MSWRTTIVDTNVVLIANGQHQDVTPACVTACTLALQKIKDSERIALDDRFLILREYLNKTQPRKGKGPGDVFVQWALQHNANPDRCDRVSLCDHAERGFVSFPDDPELSDFDEPDRKFVAVAAAHTGHPPIQQAADSKWLNWEPALRRHGVQVLFLCEEDIQRFYDNKFGA